MPKITFIISSIIAPSVPASPTAQTAAVSTRPSTTLTPYSGRNFCVRAWRRSGGSAEKISALRISSSVSSRVKRCSSSTRQPCNSSATVTFSCSASGTSREISSTLKPRSHLLTALSETYRQAASSFWVMPFSLRSCARKLPKAILFSSYIVLSSL